MKWDCGPDREEKRRLEKETRLKRLADAAKAENTWVRWFAWWPTQVGNHDCRWLEYIERKPYFRYCYSLTGVERWDVLGIWYWDYRAIE